MKTQGSQTLPRELSRSLRVQKRSQWLLFVIVSLIVVSFLSTLQICMKHHETSCSIASIPKKRQQSFVFDEKHRLISHGQHRSSAVPDGPRWSSMVLSGSEASCRQSHLYLATASRMHCIDSVWYCVGRVGLPTLPSCNATLDILDWNLTDKLGTPSGRVRWSCSVASW